MTAVTLQDLTTGAVNGTGVFDKLMGAAKAHLEQEFLQNRIKGPEYSQVYLGSLTQVMQTAVQFLATARKIDLEALLLQAQIDLTNAQKDLVLAQLEGLDTEEALKQAQTALVAQQTLNAVQEGKNLVAQECLLKSQFNVSEANVLSTQAQTDLLKQKIVTEKAQTTELGVDDNSVIGKQKALYGAQKEGFARDAEQKAASTLIQTWNTQRMTDDGIQANATNMLNDVALGRVINKLLTGIGA